ncbi:MaoC/PaaZ C-terminal domain-containing protein [Mesorhizobium sp. ORM6]
MSKRPLGTTAAIVEAFAGMTGDRFELHMSDEAAMRHSFPNRLAHGLLIGLKNNAVARFRAVNRKAAFFWKANASRSG